jgi:hypothetical protein
LRRLKGTGVLKLHGLTEVMICFVGPLKSDGKVMTPREAVGFARRCLRELQDIA